MPHPRDQRPRGQLNKNQHLPQPNSPMDRSSIDPHEARPSRIVPAKHGQDRRWVSIKLVALAPNQKLRFPQRFLTLRAGQSVLIGRSSQRLPDLAPSPSNTYFDNPILSRLHMRLSMEDGLNVYAEDLASRHGTRINDHQLPPNSPRPVFTGDRLQFGGPIAVGNEIVSPLSVRMTIDSPWGSGTNVPFVARVPDDDSSVSSDGESCYDNESPPKLARLRQQIRRSRESFSPPPNQMNGPNVIDLTGDERARARDSTSRFHVHVDDLDDEPAFVSSRPMASPYTPAPKDSITTTVGDKGANPPGPTMSVPRSLQSLLLPLSAPRDQEVDENNRVHEPLNEGHGEDEERSDGVTGRVHDNIPFVSFCSCEPPRCRTEVESHSSAERSPVREMGLYGSEDEGDVGVKTGRDEHGADSSADEQDMEFCEEDATDHSQSEHGADSSEDEDVADYDEGEHDTASSKGKDDGVNFGHEMGDDIVEGGAHYTNGDGDVGTTQEDSILHGLESEGEEPTDRDTTEKHEGPMPDILSYGYEGMPRSSMWRPWTPPERGVYGLADKLASSPALDGHQDGEGEHDKEDEVVVEEEDENGVERSHDHEGQYHNEVEDGAKDKIEGGPHGENEGEHYHECHEARVANPSGLEFIVELAVGPSASTRDEAPPTQINRKRKVDDISTLSKEEEAVLYGESARPSGAQSEAATRAEPDGTGLGVVFSPDAEQLDRSNPMANATTTSSDPSAPDVVVPAKKRLRRAAEALTYAAIGGAAVFSALVATAPNL